MSVVQEVLHWVNLFLFSLCVPAYLWCLLEVCRCDKPKPIRLVAGALCICAVSLSLMFVWLQTTWAGAVYRGAVPVHASWTWMLYDYLISCYMLCVASVVKVYCAWQGRLQNVDPPNRQHRRWTDAGP